MDFTLNVSVFFFPFFPFFFSYCIHASSLLFSCDYYIFALHISYAQRILCWETVFGRLMSHEFHCFYYISPSIFFTIATTVLSGIERGNVQTGAKLQIIEKEKKSKCISLFVLHKLGLRLGLSFLFSPHFLSPFARCIVSNTRSLFVWLSL